MLMPDGGKPDYILWEYRHPSLPHILQCTIHVDRVPEDDCIDHKPQGAQLLFLSFTVALAHLPLVPIEDFACQTLVLIHEFPECTTEGKIY